MRNVLNAFINAIFKRIIGYPCEKEREVAIALGQRRTEGRSVRTSSKKLYGGKDGHEIMTGNMGGKNLVLNIINTGEQRFI